MRVLPHLLWLSLSGVASLAACSNDVGGEGEGEGAAGEGEGEGATGEGEGEGASAGEGEGEGEGGGGGEGEGEGGTLVPGTTTLTIPIGNEVAFTAVQVVPAAVTAHRVPAVIALHGNGDSADNFVAALGLEGIANASGFVLVAPQGQERDVQAFGQDLGVLSWDPYNDRPANIDLLMLDAVVAQLTASGSVDTAAIYVFGYSQGGFLSFRYAIDHSTTIAAAVVASAGSPLGSGLVSDAQRTIPVALRIGSNDGLVSVAQSSRDALQSHGHEVLYEEIPGAGHVPFPGDVPSLFTWLLTHTL